MILSERAFPTKRLWSKKLMLEKLMLEGLKRFINVMQRCNTARN